MDSANDTGDQPDVRVGTILAGRYRIVRRVAGGGMGVVYEALANDRSPVAIKFPLAGRDASTQARFRREAELASRVVHRNVVRILDVGVDQLDPYIVMEFVRGHDLRDLASRSELSLGRVLEIGHQLLLGLTAIHDAGLIHRDLKPGNVMVVDDDDRDLVKIMDFGIARPTAPDATGITSTNQVIGTPRYMAPEQLLGLSVDHRADIYAVGATMFELICGMTPFGATEAAREAALLSDDPPSLAAFDGVPPHVADAIARALSRHPRDRFADAASFAAALEGSQPEVPAGRLDAPTVDRRPPGDFTRSRPRPPALTRIAIVMAIAVIAIASTALVYHSFTGSPAPTDALGPVTFGDTPVEIPIGTPPTRLDAALDAVIDAPAARDAGMIPRPSQVNLGTAGLRCWCVLAAPDNRPLCPTNQPRRCRCIDRLRDGLCPTPTNCDARAALYRLSGTPDDSCTGTHPGRPELEQGRLDCHVCEDPWRRVYRGEPRDPCMGYDSHGQLVAGRLYNCVP